jgi:hypothetical protein
LEALERHATFDMLERMDKMAVIVISGRSPNNQIVIYAVAIGSKENNELVAYLLTFCERHGLNLNQAHITILSDRGSALISCIDKFAPLAFHLFCALHLEGNLRSAHVLQDLSLYWQARNARTKSEYDAAMSDMSSKAPKQHAYLLGIEKWAVYVGIERGMGH